MALSRRARAAGGDSQDIATQVVNETLSGMQEHDLRRRRFDNAYEIYRANSTAPTREQRAWQSRIRVKYAMLIINENIVSVIQGIPKATCMPRRSTDVIAAKAMEKILGYFSDMDHLAEKQWVVAAQASVYGVSPGKNHWLYREADRSQLARATDPLTGATLWTPGTSRVVEDDRPTFEPWDAYDCWWEPTARDVDTAAYVVLRSWLTKQQLEDRRYDETTGQGTYRNLDQLYQAGAGQQPPSTAQNRLLNGDTQNFYKGRFEIWEVWRNNRLTTLGNRQVVLNDGAKPYWMKGKPIVIANMRPDPFRLEGISETELVDHIQQALWTSHNLRFDQWKMTVLRGATVRETVPDMAQLVFRPSFLWPVTDHDDIQFQDPPPLPPEAYQEDALLMDKLGWVTGITGYVTGNVGPTAGRSATAVSVLSKAAHAPLEFKAECLRLGVWQRTYEQWADLTKQFLTTPREFQIDGLPDGENWVKLGPEDVFSDDDINVQATEQSLDKEAKQAQIMGLLNSLAPFAATGAVNVPELLRAVAEAFDFPNPEALIPAITPGPPPAAPNGLGANGVPNAPQPNQLGNGNVDGAGLAPHPLASLVSGHAR